MMNNAAGVQSGGHGQHTILIIDDDADWTEAFKLYFDDKYQVLVANSANEAIEMIRKQQPNVIIVDLVMPSIDGFGMIHRLKLTGDSPIPTILVTGWKTPDVEECAATFGCTAVLSKPVALPVLDEVVSSVVSGTAAVAKAGQLW